MKQEHDEPQSGDDRRPVKKFGSLRTVVRVLLKLWHFIYFPDEFIVYSDVVVRLIFTLYYLPVMALALALTHSLLLSVVYTLIVPITKELEFELALNRENIRALTSFVYSLTLQMIPFAVLGGAICTVGHKAINGVGEAMVDAFSRVDDKDYPLLAARVEFIFQKAGRVKIFVGSLATILALVGAVFYSNWILVWSARDSKVLWASWGIILSQVVFVLYTSLISKSVRGGHWPVVSSTSQAIPTSPVSPLKHSLPNSLDESILTARANSSQLSLSSTQTRGEECTPHPVPQRRHQHQQSHPKSFLFFFVGRWWKTSIHRIRHLSMEMVVCCGAYWVFSCGPVEAIGLCVEVLLYLNLPHLLGFLVLSVSVAVARALQSFFWLNRHRCEFLSVLLVVMPHQLAIVSSWMYFGYHPLISTLFFVMSFLLWARGIQLLREHDVTPSGGFVLWRETASKHPIAMHIAAVLEDAYERKHPVPSMVCLDVSLDLSNMVMTPRNQPSLRIERIEQPHNKRPSSFFELRKLDYFLFALPRLFALQSQGSFGGRRFRNVRVLLRTVTVTLLIALVFIVSGMVIQAAFPQLRPVPVRVSVSSDNTMTIDHFIVKLSAQVVSSKNASVSAGSMMSGDELQQADVYPSLCAKKVGGVLAWELSWLSVAAYVTDRNAVRRIVSFMNEFMGSHWEVRFPSSLDDVDDSDDDFSVWDGYMEFYNAPMNLSVISVRGTDLTSFADVLQDVNMFFEVALYQIFSNIVPGASVLPSSLVADFIKLGAGVESISRTRSWQSLSKKFSSEAIKSKSDFWNSTNSREYYASVYNYIVAAKHRPEPPKNVVLVGHSLGGAVGHIVGSKLSLQSLGFSSPGLTLSRKKFDVELQHIHRFTTTIISSHDIVPLIGGQGGELHNIECVASKRELCHAMEFMVGTLWHSCASVRRAFPRIRDIVLI